MWLDVPEGKGNIPHEPSSTDLVLRAIQNLPSQHLLVKEAGGVGITNGLIFEKYADLATHKWFSLVARLVLLKRWVMSEKSFERIRALP